MTKRFTVVGGGISGLTAALALAERGHRVTLHEQSRHLGGRASTNQDQGYSLNLGPHALYRHGAAHRQFQRWGIPVPGRSPRLKSRAHLVMNAQLFQFPLSAARLFLTGALSLRDKLAAASVLQAFNSTDPASVAGTSLGDFLDTRFRPGRARLFIDAFVRLLTFAPNPEILDAGAALRQIRLGLKGGVLYIDRGWDTLVQGLETKAVSLGVEIHTASPVDRLPNDTDGVVLAIPPDHVASLTGWKPPAIEPARMATLDLGLRDARPEWARFGIGMDCPMYLSMHSETAQLTTQPGSAMVHVSKYIGAHESASREQLEAFADLLMPGWHEHAEVARYRPSLTVVHALPTTAGRPGVDALGIDGVAIAGEWVGHEGMLTDAAVASALRAAELVSGTGDLVACRQTAQAATS
jgi:hypothetical protein